MTDRPVISVVIPALNEELSIAQVVRGIRGAGLPGTVRVIVGDNGSHDRTAAFARSEGAEVVFEPRRGYGAACLAAIEVISPDTDIVLFMDADGSDDPVDALAIVAPLLSGEADLVIGSRVLGLMESGAMSIPQRVGNRLAVTLIRWIWHVEFTDLGPFRAIRRSALDRLCMSDRDFGWTVEMQVRAARLGLAVQERPAAYRRRIGRSKISGTVKGVVRAGTKILYIIAREALSRPRTPDPRNSKPGKLGDVQTEPCRGATPKATDPS